MMAAMETWPYPPTSARLDVEGALRALTAAELALPAPSGAWMPPNLERRMRLEAALEVLGRAQHAAWRTQLVELYERHHLPEIRHAAGRALLAMASDEELRVGFGMDRAALAKAIPLAQVALGDVGPLIEALLGRKPWKKPIAARKPARAKPSSKVAAAPFKRFGAYRLYDGDNPWWTLRFVNSLTRDERLDVAHRVEKRGELTADTWKGGRELQIGAQDPFFETQRAWNAFYSRVERLFAELHAQFPLSAVFFQDAGKPRK
jgi:hypothetical protein